jgi:hypothetical protein
MPISLVRERMDGFLLYVMEEGPHGHKQVLGDFRWDEGWEPT